MGKKIKIILIGILIAFIGYYPFIIITYIIMNKACGHTLVYGKKVANSYSWIFKDSVKRNFNPFFTHSFVKRHDIYNHYIYKNHYMVTIWDFKDLNGMELKNIEINTNMYLETGEEFGTFVDGIGKQIKVKYGFSFGDKMKINLDEYSSIIKRVDTTNYKGFYGTINRMAFSNEDNEDCISFNFTDRKSKAPDPAWVLFYKTHKGFFVIIIESNDSVFDQNIINILDLK